MVDVSTLVVEWIEILQGAHYILLLESLNKSNTPACHVSTLVVEWIEISNRNAFNVAVPVSTLVVEWIEICAVFQCGVSGKSPPSWWSGLKCYYLFYLTFADFVSTLVVEWIEILPGRPALPCLPAVSTLVVEWIEISCRS